MTVPHTPQFAFYRAHAHFPGLRAVYPRLVPGWVRTVGCHGTHARAGTHTPFADFPHIRLVGLHTHTRYVAHVAVTFGWFWFATRCLTTTVTLVYTAHTLRTGAFSRILAVTRTAPRTTWFTRTPHTAPHIYGCGLHTRAHAHLPRYTFPHCPTHTHRTRTWLPLVLVYAFPLVYRGSTHTRRFTPGPRTPAVTTHAWTHTLVYHTRTHTRTHAVYALRVGYAHPRFTVTHTRIAHTLHTRLPYVTHLYVCGWITHGWFTVHVWLVAHTQLVAHGCATPHWFTRFTHTRLVTGSAHAVWLRSHTATRTAVYGYPVTLWITVTHAVRFWLHAAFTHAFTVCCICHYHTRLRWLRALHTAFAVGSGWFTHARTHTHAHARGCTLVWITHTHARFTRLRGSLVYVYYARLHAHARLRAVCRFDTHPVTAVWFWLDCAHLIQLDFVDLVGLRLRLRWTFTHAHTRTLHVCYVTLLLILI